MDLLDLYVKFKADKSDLDAGLKDAESSAEGMAQKIGGGLKTAAKIGGAAIAAASAAVVGFAKTSVDAGMSFDSSMSQVAATMGKTTDEIQDLRDFAQQMGATTAFSATQAADALNYMALAGYDSEQAMEALPNVLNLAASGGIDLAYASDMVTDAQSALGLSMEESAELVDKMAQTASKSNTSVAQLGEAILTVGGTAKNLAGGTTELSTALGILADNGVKGAEGGTALRNIILSLTAPTDNAASALKDLGIEVFDAEGNMRPLNDTFKDLNDILSQMTQKERGEVLNDIFNKVDLKSVNALLANTGDRFDELSGYIDNATGAAQKMADTQLDNLSGDITLFQSALEGAQIAISDKLTPSLRDFVQFGSEGLSELTEALREGDLDSIVDTLSNIFEQGLALIIEKAPMAIEAGAQILIALANGIIQNLPTLAESALQIILQLATSIAEAIPQMMPQVVEVILAIVDTLTNPDSISQLVDAAVEIIVAIADGLIEALPRLIEKAPTIIANLVTALIQNAPKLLKSAVEIVGAIATGIGNNLGKIKDKAVELIKKFKDKIKEKVQDIKNIGKDIVEGVWNGISAKVEWFRQKVSDFFSNIVGGVKDLLGINSPSKVFAEIGDNMTAGLGKGWNDSVSDVKKGIEDDLNFTGTAATANIAAGGSGTIQGMAANMDALLGAIQNMDVILDSGALVGGISAKMDRELGRRAYRNERGA